MKYGIREVDSKKTKILKLIVGIVGGLVCVGTLVLGAVAGIGLSLPIVFGLLVCGVLPAEVILTCVSVKNTKVETVSEELVEELYVDGNELVKVSFYAIDDEIIEGPYEEVVAEKINGRFVYFDPNMKKKAIKENKGVVGHIEFTSINPIDHSYDEVSTHNLARKKIIEFKPRKGQEEK